MKKRIWVKFGLPALLLFTLISCTSGNNLDDQGDDSLEVTDQASDEFGTADEFGTTDEFGGTDLLGDSALNDDSSSQSTDLDESLALDDNSQDAQTDDLAGATSDGSQSSTPDGGLDTASGSDLQTDPLALGGESSPDPSADLAVEDHSADTATIPSWEPPPTPFANAAASPAPPKTYIGVKAPRISPNAIQRGNSLLNRFYFVRSGDTPETVSQLIYADASRQQDLKTWNRGKWKPGKLLYYSSPTEPNDPRMLSLYEERGLVPEVYTVAKGDWISRIATARLGSPASWKEIVAVNGLDSPDAVTVGQDLKIYTDLSMAEKPAEPMHQADANMGSQPMAQATPAIPPVDAPVPPPVTTPGAKTADAMHNSTAEDPMTTAGADKLKSAAKKQRSGGLDISKLLQQNAFFIIVGLIISGLLVTLLAASKRRNSGDDFDEGFAAPSTQKRK